MKEKKRSSKTDWKRFDKMKDEDIDYSDIPELDDDFFKNAKPIDLKKMLQSAEGKKQITLRIDHKVVDWFKKQGKGYQSTMNNVLRNFVDAQEKTT